MGNLGTDMAATCDYWELEICQIGLRNLLWNLN